MSQVPRPPLLLLLLLSRWPLQCHWHRPPYLLLLLLHVPVTVCVISLHQPSPPTATLRVCLAPDAWPRSTSLLVQVTLHRLQRHGGLRMHGTCV